VNFEGNSSGSMDELISPTYDLSHISSLIKVKFSRAYVGKKVDANPLAELLYGTSTADTIYDKLTFSVSMDCGKTWAVKKTYSGESLATWSPKTTSFMADSIKFWKQDSIFITGVTDKTNLKFKFSFTGKGGNNIFIDRVCTGECGVVGLGENISDLIDLSIYPIPVKQSTMIRFNLVETSDVAIDVVDVLGRKVISLVDKSMSQGEQQLMIHRSQFETSGIYLVRMIINNQLITRKIVVE